ncbi:MAG: YbgC/FadM family acyl-CoA thioesterase [Stagnimonas sp.]|nr:YbgC/FadM family acyl-CoA thioesterase [Stagnimonas sp.]
MGEIFTWPIRIYYEDTDASGVAYHARYLNWFERARSEWLRAKGRSHQRMAAEFGSVFTVVSIDIRYRQPARLDDALLATVTVAQQGHASLVFEQKLLRPESPENPLAIAQVKVACVDASSFKPRAWPVGWLEP